MTVATITALETGGVSYPVAAVTWVASTAFGFLGSIARGYIEELTGDDD